MLDEDQINYEDSDPEDNSDKLMMTEYDEDNVIVIDLRCEISSFCLLSFPQNERTYLCSVCIFFETLSSKNIQTEQNLVLSF